MKTRNGFVSNSSSTSFVIAYKNGEPCPHCGRSDPDWADFFEDKSETFSDATYLEHGNADGIICEEQEEIKKNNEYIQGLNKRPDEEPAFPELSSTVASYRSGLEKDNKEREDFCKKIKEFIENGFAVIELQISYHDEQSDKMIFDAKENGTIVVLKESG